MRILSKEEHRKYRKETGYSCDKCGKSGERQLVLSDEVWAEIVEKFSDRPFTEPKQTLLCVDCMEELLGQKIQKEDLKIDDKDGHFIPVNCWWILENDEIDYFIPSLRKTLTHLDDWGKKYGLLNGKEVNRSIVPAEILDRLQEA